MAGFGRKRPVPRAPATTRLRDDDLPARRARQDAALGWIMELLEADPADSHRRPCGCEAAHLAGRLCLVTAAKREPWNGLLVCTSLDRQPGLRAEWPALSPHAVPGKWLYVSRDHLEFEPIATALTRRVLARDARFGVAPKPRTRRRKAAERPSRR